MTPLVYFWSPGNFLASFIYKIKFWEFVLVNSLCWLAVLLQWVGSPGVRGQGPGDRGQGPGDRAFLAPDLFSSLFRVLRLYPGQSFSMKFMTILGAQKAVLVTTKTMFL